MEHRYLKISLFIIALALLSFKPDHKESKKMNWLTFEQVIELQKTNPKKIIVDVYTNWCGWCKKMDKATYSDSSIISQIEEDYYIVKFNAEQKEPITFRDKTFNFSQQYRSHELAVGLLSGKMSYPSTVFLDENMDILTVVPGYMEPPQLSPILNYFGKNIYKNKTWAEYEKTFNQ
jgi:thioredoxin-related protein